MNYRYLHLCIDAERLHLVLFLEFLENQGYSSCWEISGCWEILRRPPKTPFSGFPSTGPLCGAFNRCIFLLSKFGKWEMLSKSPFLASKTAWNNPFFFWRKYPFSDLPEIPKNRHCVPGGKLQLSIIPGSSGAWKYSEIFPRFQPAKPGKYRALYLAWGVKGDELPGTVDSLYEYFFSFVL